MPFLAKRGDADLDRMLGVVYGGNKSWGDAGISSQSITDTVGQTGSCANPECKGGWRAPWKSRRRPIFEGYRACSGSCLLSIVREAVRRETGSAGPTERAPHRHRIPLGLLLLAQGWISQEQLQRGLQAQKNAETGRIGDWLTRACGVEPEQITRGLGMQWGCPVLTPDGFLPEAMALIMPRLLIEQFGSLPLRVAASKILYLASAAAVDASLAFAVEQMTGLHVESGIMEEGDFEDAQERLCSCTAVACKYEVLPDQDSVAARITALLEREKPIASRLVRAHQYYWLRMWLESGTRGRSGSLPLTSEDMLDFVFSIG